MYTTSVNTLDCRSRLPHSRPSPEEGPNRRDSCCLLRVKVNSFPKADRRLAGSAVTDCTTSTFCKAVLPLSTSDQEPKGQTAWQSIGPPRQSREIVFPLRVSQHHVYHDDAPGRSRHLGPRPHRAERSKEPLIRSTNGCAAIPYPRYSNRMCVLNSLVYAR